MAIYMMTKPVKVLTKFTNTGKNKEGNDVTYYNFKIADTETYDNQIIGVNEEMYNSVDEGDLVSLAGKFGGLKTKYWYFEKLRKEKDK